MVDRGKDFESDKRAHTCDVTKPHEHIESNVITADLSPGGTELGRKELGGDLEVQDRPQSGAWVQSDPYIPAGKHPHLRGAVECVQQEEA